MGDLENKAIGESIKNRTREKYNKFRSTQKRYDAKHVVCVCQSTGYETVYTCIPHIQCIQYSVQLTWLNPFDVDCELWLTWGWPTNHWSSTPSPLVPCWRCLPRHASPSLRTAASILYGAFLGIEINDKTAQNPFTQVRHIKTIDLW